MGKEKQRRCTAKTFYLQEHCLLSLQTMCTSADIPLESETWVVWKGTELPYPP